MLLLVVAESLSIRKDNVLFILFSVIVHTEREKMRLAISYSNHGRAETLD
jgi:hypothetical protein